MEVYRQPTSSTSAKDLPMVYILAAIFTFQSLLVAYAHSSFIEEFIAVQYVSWVFSAGAGLSLLFFLLMPRLLTTIGNTALAVIIMMMLVTMFLILGFSLEPTLIIAASIIMLALSPLLYYNIDIYIETIMGSDESKTGTLRGILLAIMSVAALIAPLTMGYLVGDTTTLAPLYQSAALIGIIFTSLLLLKMRRFADPTYERVPLAHYWSLAISQRNVSLVLGAHFLLQLFFTWAVIYVPLYLATTVGFSWVEIGAIMAVGLLAFTLFELPIGYVADHYIGEKEMMVSGFFILAITTGMFGFLGTASVAVWMGVMFVSRIGASLVEATTESYFFKQTTGNHGTLISLFRMLRPIANLVGAVIGSIALLFLPLSLTFTVFGLILVLGMLLALPLEDTR